MPKRIIANSCSVAELFSDAYRFLLPYYQRGYAWQEEHVLRLVDDILDVVDGKVTDRLAKLGWYPLGSIIVAKPDGVADAWLADGHQRLITLTILIAILRDLEKDAELAARLGTCVFAAAGGAVAPRLVTQAAARTFLDEYVQAADATRRLFRGDIDERTDSEANIIANRDRLRKRIAALTVDRRRKLARFVLDDCQIVVVEVESEDIARMLFSTMHDTGIKPSPGDLFKAEVLGTIEPEPREAAQATWEGLEARLGRERLDQLFRQIAIISERRLPKGHVETMLEQTFALSTSAGARKFVETRLAPLGAHLVDVDGAPTGTGGLPPAAQRRLQYLSWVRNHDTWLAPVLHWLDVAGHKPGETVEFLRRLEVLAWVQMITAEEPADRDARYMRLIGEIADGTAMTAGSSLDISAAHRTEVRRVLGGPNFTRRKYKQFLLLRCDSAIIGDDKVHLPDLATVEHIYPSNPAARSEWVRDFRGDEGNSLRQTLGNLTLLTGIEQNEAKNAEFGTKRRVFERSVFALTRQIAAADAWNPGAVRRRTGDLVDLLMTAWRLA